MAIEEFNNKERLKKIREESLNPLISKVTKNIDPRLGRVETELSGAITTAELDPLDNKRIVFHKIGGGEFDLDLHHSIPEEFPGVTAIGTTGNATDLNTLTFKDAEVTGVGAKGARVAYDWKKLVEGNQREVYGQVGGSSPEAIRTFQYSGDTSKIEVRSGVATLTIPKAEPITAQVKSKKGEISSIIVTGETDGCEVDNGILTLNMKAGGGGVPLSSGNFVGFFDNLGELESEVTNPLNGKSMAFIKDATFTTGTYYDAWMYVNNKWTEVPNDPGVTYEPITVAGKQGVFSIKPSPYISIDSNGQLDLDRLAEAGGFAGFFDSQAALETAVPHPIPERSYGYIRMASGSWMGRRYVRNTQTGEQEWINTVPIGATAIVTKGTGSSSDVTEIAYGFTKNDMIDINHTTGLATIKPSSGGGLTGVIEDSSGAGVDRPVEKLRFVRGNTYVEYYTSDKSMKIQPAQQVITYTADFEADHNDQDYKGNIFYDDNTNTWMGWATPKAPGAVDKKWSHIAHEGMSTEVKGLSKRLPSKTPSVSGGTLGDDAQWEHTGWTYVEPVLKDDPSDLPDAIKLSGAYVQTYVKNIAGETGIPQARMQTCFEDSETSSQWIRMFDPNPPGSGDPVWKKWVRTSFSQKDIEAHSKDHAAHKDIIKYHVVFALTGGIFPIFSQTAGDALGGLHEDNGLMIVDNYGYTNKDKDYMDPPYSGKFRISGVLSFSGYNEKNKNYPLGRWQIIFRKRDQTTGIYGPIAQFYYVHTDDKVPYPSIAFLAEDVDLLDSQEVVINLSFDNPTGLKNKHPNLYLAPTRSYLVLEDNETTTGTLIGEAHRKLYGNLDVTGEVGIKSHHSNLADPSSAIRVYGEKLDKTPKVMIKV
ncbi:MAG: hypothetical protein ACRC6V_01375 [Bacteroidales bacterium]